MGYRSANLLNHSTLFNSDSSAKLLTAYEKIIESEIQKDSMQVKHRTFAPSMFRCDRVNWFRLRGTQPDVIQVPDKALDFTAKIGTACHHIIQSRLSEYLGADWLDVAEWLETHRPSSTYTVEKSGYETLVEFQDPPVRFACDGLIRFNGKVYLLEIKSSEYTSFDNLTGPKEKHIDQVKCYASLLNVQDVLFMYIDRQYGGVKCFEMHINELQMKQVRDRMARVMELVEANIAPDGLPKGDPDCSSNMCPYFKVCKQWGRF